MPTKRLYLQPIPDGAQLQDTDSLQANLSQQGLLGGGSAVEQLSNQPGDHLLQGQYRCQSAAGGERMARELRELGNSDGFDALPLYRVDGISSDDGYYVVERVEDAGPVEPQEPAIQKFRLSLSEKGSHETRWSAVETTPILVDHEFGNNTTSKIATPATASKRRWYDPTTGATVPVESPLSTPATEHGTVAIYDVDAGEAAVGTGSAKHGPTLLYELPYVDEGVVDPVLWDTLGNADKLLSQNGSTVRQWQHVFSTGHEFDGQPVLDSGRLRVTVDESAGDLVAETWDDANDEWSGVGLDWSTTDWALYDWDVTHISPTSVRSHATFEHPDDGYFELDAALDRGRAAIRWNIPANEDGPIPAELENVLAPIASDELADAQPVRELVARSEVRK